MSQGDTERGRAGSESRSPACPVHPPARSRKQLPQERPGLEGPPFPSLVRPGGRRWPGSSRTRQGSPGAFLCSKGHLGHYRGRGFLKVSPHLTERRAVPREVPTLVSHMEGDAGFLPQCPQDSTWNEQNLLATTMNATRQPRREHSPCLAPRVPCRFPQLSWQLPLRIGIFGGCLDVTWEDFCQKALNLGAAAPRFPHPTRPVLPRPISLQLPLRCGLASRGTAEGTQDSHSSHGTTAVSTGKPARDTTRSASDSHALAQSSALALPGPTPAWTPRGTSYSLSTLAALLYLLGHRGSSWLLRDPVSLCGIPETRLYPGLLN